MADKSLCYMKHFELQHHIQVPNQKIDKKQNYFPINTIKIKTHIMFIYKKKMFMF